MPTAPAPAAGTYLAGMRPFAIRAPDQFRPAGPPALDSKDWAEGYNEVKALGAASSGVRSAEQTEAARFYAEAPVPQAHNAFRKFVGDHDLDIGDAARFLAMAGVTFADAQIACFDAKYHFAFWRPVTAIRAGDTDGNDATPAQAGWTPLLATPNHPEYPSAHSCISPTLGMVAARVLGTEQIDLTVPSLAGLGDRHFDSAKAMIDAVSDARIWGGIHFRSAVEDGAVIAKRTAHFVLAHNFKEIVDERPPAVLGPRTPAGVPARTSTSTWLLVSLYQACGRKGGAESSTAYGYVFRALRSSLTSGRLRGRPVRPLPPSSPWCLMNLSCCPCAPGHAQDSRDL